MAKKKTSNNSSAPAKNSKAHNKLASTLANCAGIMALVVCLVFLYLAFVDRPNISNTVVAAQTQSLADSQVSQLDQALSQLRERLTSIASSQQLIAALDQGDEAQLEMFRQELKRAFPEALSSKLIALGPMGIASLNKESRGLRNNIELDLLRHVSNGKNVEPEAYKIENRWLFSLAAPIQSLVNKDYATGALLVTLDDNYLRTLLSQLDNSLGQTILIQQFKNKQHVISSTGIAANDAIIQTSDATVSHWRITFSPSAELINKTKLGTMAIWPLLAVCLIAILGAIYYAKGRLNKLLMDNLKLLVANNTNEADFNLPGFSVISGHFKKPSNEESKHAELVVEKPVEQLVADNNNPSSTPIDSPIKLPEDIFRAYDIRGLADTELTEEVVHAIGLAIGSEAMDQGQQSLIVCADGRHSSPKIHDALTKGLLASGQDIIDIGIQPTPLMYFATHQLGTQSGVMITGSHNPAEYNGLKIVINGQALSEQAIEALKQRIINKDFSSGQGEYTSQDIEHNYIDYIINDVAIAQPLKIVIDAGNGVTGKIAPRLFEELGCEIIPLYCDVDGDFPNHHPDPTVESNLSDLKQKVAEESADLGIAFDGDGDRLGVVTSNGNYVPADRLLMLFAQDVVSRNPGADVIFDVKCTRNLNTLISNYGGRPIMWKSGHSYMKEKMLETGALLGGEFSGHIFFKERWFGFDDGMYAAARLVEILSTTDPDLDLQLEAFPDSLASPEFTVETTDQQKFLIIEKLLEQEFSGAKISTLDGLRADYPDGWGLVRASNTTPMLTLRFEADDQEAMGKIQDQFKLKLHNIDDTLLFEF